MSAIAPRRHAMLFESSSEVIHLVLTDTNSSAIATCLDPIPHLIFLGVASALDSTNYLCATDKNVVDGYVDCRKNANHQRHSRRRSLIPSMVGSRRYILSLTIYPMTPIIKKPMPTAWLIRKNSRLSAVTKVSVSYHTPCTLQLSG